MLSFDKLFFKEINISEFCSSSSQYFCIGACVARSKEGNVTCVDVIIFIPTPNLKILEYLLSREEGFVVFQIE